MKTYAKTLLFVAATCFALVSSSKAQLVTFETISTWTGSNYTFNPANRDYAQTFTNVTQVESMTYRFVAGSNALSSLDINAQFVLWNGTNNISSAIGTVVQNVGTITIPSTSSWAYDSVNGLYYYDMTINLGQATDHTKTYAMVLNSTTTSQIGLSITNDDTFAFGEAARQSNAGGSISYAGNDWGFSQLVVAPYVAPTPESGTMAAIAGAVLVAGLVGLRLRQRRQLAPVAAA